MNGKKIAIIVLLIAVIGVATAFTVTRILNEAGGPTLYVDQKFEKIDMKSYEVFGETNSDWQTKYTPDASGHWKNPKTGEYTLTYMMKCASCGRPIPLPQLPAELRPKTASGRPSRADTEAIAEAMHQYELIYKCPLCGKNAFETVASPAPSKSK
ncbi:MAG: hypothetical protein ABSA67_12575 [Candidatus Brocadiia bacterium]|jgi:rRNA maturation protein Nop10